jgi:hypothetical protein
MANKIEIYTIGCYPNNLGVDSKNLREKLNEVAEKGRVISVVQRLNTNSVPMDWVIVVELF